MRQVIILLFFTEIFGQEFQLDESELIPSMSFFSPFSDDKNWLLRDSAIKSNESIVLTELKKTRFGSIWNNIPNAANSWKLELQYTSFNPSYDQQIADGIALWYLPPSAQRNYKPVLGSYGGPEGNFTGLLIAIDPYPQPGDKSVIRHVNQSVIIVVHNEKSRKYDFDSEGFDTLKGRCIVENRYFETNESFATLALSYDGSKLTLYHTTRNGMLQKCVAVDVKLPVGYNFGVSAATGGHFGVFEVRHFKFYSKSLSQNEHMAIMVDSQSLFHMTYSLTGLVIVVIFLNIAIVVILLKSRYQKNFETGFVEPQILYTREKTIDQSEYEPMAVTAATNDYDHLNFQKFAPGTTEIPVPN